MPNFRGVYMRDSLPKLPKINECAIVNLDSSDNLGTHWVAYVKKGINVNYFDAFGNLRPPLELLKYFDGCKILYNRRRYQDWETPYCGHYCLLFLYKNA